MKKWTDNLWVLCGITAMLLGMSLFGSTAASPMDTIETSNAEADEATLLETANPLDEDTAETDEQDLAPLVPQAINGLLIGFDKSGGLTDVIMVGHIDPAEEKIQIISIPRDLEIFFNQPGFSEIKKANPNNHILHAKLNNLYYHLGWDQRALMDIRSIVEVITGLEIDYMMTIDISGFKDMVDAVGGVDFYVPQDMKYDDPAQDLYIDLKKGQQILDGEKAMELVRFRKGYTMGDLQRIKVQQAFLAAMVDQVLHESTFDELTNLMTTTYNLIESDFGLAVAIQYVQFFFELDMTNLLSEDNMITIPSYGEQEEGIWIQYFDLDQAHKAVKSLINGDKVAEEQHVE